jgi:Ca-activated chloride channel family protein
MKKNAAILCLVLVFLAGSRTWNVFAQQQQQQLTRILFVFDASQSMLGRWQSATKMQIAVKLLNELVDSLKKQQQVELALRVFGHQKQYPPQDCDDTKLEVPFQKNNHERIKNFLKNTQPRGTTPIAMSLEATANDFPKGTNSRNIIILITDGKEECGGDPCAVSAALQKNNVILKPFIIGVGLGDEIKTSLKCVGNYYDANTEESFRDVLKIVITQALYPTTAQVNLLDTYKKPTETNVPITFYESRSGRIVHNFVHTLNHAGNPDTLYLDNFLTYRLKVHTIPPVEKDDIVITQGKHNVIAVDAPQGSIQLKINGRNQYGVVKCIVRKSGSLETLHVQDMGTSVKYLTGTYDLEILTLPRIYQRNVKVSQSTTTTIEIEEAGLVNFQFGNVGYGSVFKIKGNDLEFVTNLSETAINQALVLQPGNYKIVFRFRLSKETILTKERTFTVKSGESIIVNLMQ